MVDKSRLMFQESIQTQVLQSGDTLVYWMNRDQRCHDNWALLYAQEMAKQLGHKLTVLYIFESDKNTETLTRREFNFIKEGLIEVEANLNTLNIPLHVGLGSKADLLYDYAIRQNASMIVTDFSPLIEAQNIRETVSEKMGVEIQVVDAHNIVPCWVTSNKEEYAARTIRPKINRLLATYLTHIPGPDVFEKNGHDQINKRMYEHNLEIGVPSKGALFLYPLIKDQEKYRVDWTSIEKTLYIDESVQAVDWIKPGYDAGMTVLSTFIKEGLSHYSQKRNDPNENAQSNLSPYLHFGHVSAQRIAYELHHFAEPSSNVDDFLEEMVVRGELTDNYCFYNSNYKSLSGIKDWAKLTLDAHALDIRDPLYTLEVLEEAKTHDQLWNAAQMEMVKYGKMHGYMRMYWAKKILEWSPSPKDATEWAIYLNDKYSLDGKDPNGYVGVLWSVGGLHDRAWREREIFGKIRYMNYNGCKRKFDVNRYIYSILGENKNG